MLKKPTKPILKPRPHSQKALKVEEIKKETAEELDERTKRFYELKQGGDLPQYVKAAYLVFSFLGQAKSALNELRMSRLEAAQATDSEKAMCESAWKSVHQLMVIYDDKLGLKILDNPYKEKSD